jgi:phospholipase/lecithinase/hemolysin
MGTIYPSTNIVTWTNAINQSLTNHYMAVTNLYAKGVRTLIMPNAVDITEVPQYDSLIMSSPAVRNFIRQQVVNFNTAFVATLNRAKTNCPSLAIYVPNFFDLLDNVLTNAAAYGLTNALSSGVSIDALDDSSLNNKALNGSGTNYIFWDRTDPTAKLHAVLADIAEQLISPAQITNLTLLNGNSQLGVASLPIGLNGFVDGTANLAPANWTSVTNVVSTNATQTIIVPVSGPMQFYRLHFPYAWSWP